MSANIVYNTKVKLFGFCGSGKACFVAPAPDKELVDRFVANLTHLGYKVRVITVGKEK